MQMKYGHDVILDQASIAGNLAIPVLRVFASLPKHNECTSSTFDAAARTVIGTALPSTRAWGQAAALVTARASAMPPGPSWTQAAAWAEALAGRSNAASARMRW